MAVGWEKKICTMWYLRHQLLSQNLLLKWVGLPARKQLAFEVLHVIHIHITKRVPCKTFATCVYNTRLWLFLPHHPLWLLRFCVFFRFGWTIDDPKFFDEFNRILSQTSVEIRKEYGTERNNMPTPAGMEPGATDYKSNVKTTTPKVLLFA